MLERDAELELGDKGASRVGASPMFGPSSSRGVRGKGARVYASGRAGGEGGGRGCQKGAKR